MSRQAATAFTKQEINSERPKRVVYYLRVSTPSQVNTDYDPEGISIPAQREKADHKTSALGAVKVDEYIEPGRTATTIDKRPKFQEMIARIRTKRDVDYIIVYHFSRVFRNMFDAAITKRELAKYGVRVVSTVLDMGESPESALVEGILHAVDQYQSEASGADIRYKMSQKAMHGGTITKAPLGYRNERITIDARLVAISSVDPDRAPHLREGFELYGTGQYSARQVLDQVTAAGLRTRGTAKTAPKPLSLNQFYNILSDPYYAGVIEYEDREYPGRHEPLIPRELFDRVQRVLALHGGGGTRQRIHAHYLKGLLWCGRCGRRFILVPGRGNGGTYFYFMCRGRDDRECDQPYLRVELVEAAVVRHYGTVRLSESFRETLRARLDEALVDDLGSLSALKKRLAARMRELDEDEDRYLDLVGRPGWPEKKLRAKLAGIRKEREEVIGQLGDASSRLTTGRDFFLAALELLRDPQAFYERVGTSLKHAMNKIVFEKLILDGDEIADHELTLGVRDLVEADSLIRRSGSSKLPTPVAPKARGHNANSRSLEEAAVWSDTDNVTLLAMAIGGHGSGKVAMVDDTGIEPMTSSASDLCSYIKTNLPPTSIVS